MSKETFKVRDLRIKEKFWLDDVYLNGYARYLKPAATAVYMSLCRHADKEQSCFPAEETIAKEHGICEKTVRNKITLLKEWNIIKVERRRRKSGKWLCNTYFLLDKSEWRKPEVKITAGQTTGKKFQNQRQLLPTKDSHSKVTHITSETLPDGKSRQVEKANKRESFRCPLLLKEKYPTFVKKYPGGHNECVEFIRAVEEEKGHKFINLPKQFGIIHRILRAGFDFDDMNKALNAIQKNNFYQDKGWDFATVAQWLERK